MTLVSVCFDKFYIIDATKSNLLNVYKRRGIERFKKSNVSYILNAHFPIAECHLFFNKCIIHYQIKAFHELTRYRCNSWSIDWTVSFFHFILILLKTKIQSDIWLDYCSVCNCRQFIFEIQLCGLCATWHSTS